MSTVESPLHTLIIGTGFGGLCMGIALKRKGIENFVLLEKGQDVGGTWRENTYPGAACDIYSHLYSFSFAPNTEWSHKYSPQPEILAYLRRCADDFGIRPKVRFGQEVRIATFDEARDLWRVTVASGEAFEARHLVTACGQLNRPAMVRAKGIETFEGPQFHSALWRHDVDLAGKTVAVIGTGASAIQFVPEIAKTVGTLKLFQRTPPYVIPRSDRGYGPLERRLFKAVPALRQLYRARTWLTGETLFKALAGNPLLKFVLEQYAALHLKRQVPDPALRAKLKPDYPIGCKRVLISDSYYPALTRDNVQLVTEAVREITPTGVVTEDGVAHTVDVIIHGTGFAATDFLAPIDITGLAGQNLRAAWKDGAEAFLGITVAGFPNLYMLYGPNTNLGHNSIVYMLESQVAYILSAIEQAESAGAKAIALKPEVQARYNAEMQQRLVKSVWAAGCHSWYTTESGKNTVNWPGPTHEYRRRTRKANLADYTLMKA